MGVRNRSLWVVLSLTFAGPALADPAPPAVWYRASESCPSGQQFLDKLAENSRSARLAQGGDHIDFVVTLVADSQGTVGRLERQTNSGIVAIRELRDATCGQVADALALSLGLALSPGQSTSEPVAKPGDVSGTSAATAAVAPSENVPPPPPVVAETSQPEVKTTAPPAPTAHEPVPTRPESNATWSVGIDISAMTGVTTHPLPRGELFLDFRPALSHFLPNLSLRGSVVGAAGSSDTAVGLVRRWILGGRAEACPVAWVAGRFDLRPCAAFELGIDNASADGENGLDDHGLWAAPAGQLRLAFALQPKLLWLEASGGAVIPLTRKEIFSGSESLYRDAAVIFHAGLGVSLRLP